MTGSGSVRRYKAMHSTPSSYPKALCIWGRAWSAYSYSNPRASVPHPDKPTAPDKHQTGGTQAGRYACMLHLRTPEPSRSSRSSLSRRCMHPVCLLSHKPRGEESCALQTSTSTEDRDRGSQGEVTTVVSKSPSSLFPTYPAAPHDKIQRRIPPASCWPTSHGTEKGVRCCGGATVRYLW